MADPARQYVDRLLEAIAVVREALGPTDDGTLTDVLCKAGIYKGCERCGTLLDPHEQEKPCRSCGHTWTEGPDA